MTGAAKGMNSLDDFLSARLFNEDCLLGMKRIPSHSVDMILADLPQGITKCKWDTVIPLKPMWQECNRVIKPGGAIVLFGNEPFSSVVRTSNIQAYRYDWKWNKKHAGNHLLAKKQPLKIYEDIMVFNSRTYYPAMRTGPMRKKGGYKKPPQHLSNIKVGYEVTNDQYYPTAILEFSNAARKSNSFACEKPVPLLEYLIKTYTLEGQTVLDFCIGSGQTVIAAINTGREWIAFEKDSGNYTLAKAKIQQHLLERAG